LFTCQLAIWGTAIVTTLEAVFLLSRSAHRSDLLFAGLYFLSLGFLFGSVAASLNAPSAPGPIGLTAMGVIAPAIPLFWLLFTAVWGRDVQNDPYLRSTRPWLGLAALAAVLLAVVALLEPFAEYVPDPGHFGYFRMGRYSFPLFLYYLTCYLFGLHNLESSLRSSVGSQRRQLRAGIFVLFALTGLAFFAATLGILYHRIDVWVMLLIAVFVPLLYLLVIRRLLQFDPSRHGVVVTRRVTSSSFVILLGGAYFIFVGLLSAVLSKENVRLETVLVLVGALLSLVLILTVLVANRLGRGGFAERAMSAADGRLPVEEFLEEIVLYKGIEELFERTRLFLQSTFDIREAAFIDAGNDSSWRAIRLGRSDHRVINGDAGALAEWIFRYGRPIRYADLTERFEEQRLDTSWLAEEIGFKPGLLAPIISRQKMVGVMVVGADTVEPEKREALEVFLETVSGPLALAIQNSCVTDELIRVQAMESFHKISSFVLHDLKNSVGMLDLLLRNAQSNIDNPQFQQSMLGTIRDAVGRQQKIIARLSDPAAAKTADRAEVDVIELLRTVVDKAQVRKIDHVELRESYRPVKPVRADRRQLASVLENLVTNALEAMAAGGTLSVATDMLDKEGLLTVIVTVGDTGRGMSREFIDNELFQPFSSTKKKGMGIGMYQSLETIRQLGGRIDVESEKGRGSRVTVVLPV